MGCPTTAAQDQRPVQSLGVDTTLLCFPGLPACHAALGYSAVPIGTQSYSFYSLAVVSVLVVYFFFISYFYLLVLLVILFVLLTLMSRSVLLLRLRVTAWF